MSSSSSSSLSSSSSTYVYLYGEWSEVSMHLSVALSRQMGRHREYESYWEETPAKMSARRLWRLGITRRTPLLVILEQLKALRTPAEKHMKRLIEKEWKDYSKELPFLAYSYFKQHVNDREDFVDAFKSNLSLSNLFDNVAWEAAGGNHDHGHRYQFLQGLAEEMEQLEKRSSRREDQHEKEEKESDDDDDDDEALLDSRFDTIQQMRKMVDIEKIMRTFFEQRKSLWEHNDSVYEQELLLMKQLIEPLQSIIDRFQQTEIQCRMDPGCLLPVGQQTQADSMFLTDMERLTEQVEHQIQCLGENGSGNDDDYDTILNLFNDQVRDIQIALDAVEPIDGLTSSTYRELFNGYAKDQHKIQWESKMYQLVAKCVQDLRSSEAVATSGSSTLRNLLKKFISELEKELPEFEANAAYNQAFDNRWETKLMALRKEILTDAMTRDVGTFYKSVLNHLIGVVINQKLAKLIPAVNTAIEDVQNHGIPREFYIFRDRITTMEQRYIRELNLAEQPIHGLRWRSLCQDAGTALTAMISAIQREQQDLLNTIKETPPFKWPSSLSAAKVLVDHRYLTRLIRNPLISQTLSKATTIQSQGDTKKIRAIDLRCHLTVVNEIPNIAAEHTHLIPIEKYGTIIAALVDINDAVNDTCGDH